MFHILVISHFACFCRMWVSVCMCVRAHRYECVEVVGELAEVCFLLLPCGVQGSNLSCLTWHRVLYLQSHLTNPLYHNFTKIFRITQTVTEQSALFQGCSVKTLGIKGKFPDLAAEGNAMECVFFIIHLFNGIYRYTRKSICQIRLC